MMINLHLPLLLVALVLGRAESRAERDIYVPECKKVNYTGQQPGQRQPFLHLFLDRESLAVTEYLGTPSVNLMLKSTVVYKDLLEEKKLDVEIMGVANAFPMDNKFRDCTVYVRKEDDDFFVEPPALNRAFDQCVSSVICEKLGSLMYDDLERGRESPYPLGPTSLESNSVRVQFPDIYPPKIDVEKIPAQYRKPWKAVDKILEYLVKTFKQNYTNGLIRMPDVSDPDNFFAAQGYFKGFDQLQLDTKVPVDSSERTRGIKLVNFDFGVFFGELEYKSFEYLKNWQDGLCGNVQELIFTAEFAMDHRQEKCKASLNELTLWPGTLRLKHCQVDYNIPPLVKERFTESWNNTIVPGFKNMMSGVIKHYFKSEFDCSPYV